MSALTFWVGLALAGALGAVARWLLDSAVTSRLGSALPWGVLSVNLSGCLLLGAVTAAAATEAGAAAEHVLAAGFLGAFTTFSTVCVDVVTMLRARRPWRLLAYLGLTLVLGTAALVAGVWATSALVGV